MKAKLLIFIFLSLLIQTIPLFAQAENPAVIFQKANTSYQNGDYTGAISAYESLIDKNWNRSNVYYNLGNAYFKEKKLGLAILNYERAKRQSPRDRDIAANLAYVRGLLEYRIEDKRNWYLKAGGAALAFFTIREIGIISLSLGFLFWMTWGISLYFQKNKPWGSVRKTLLIVTVGSFSLWMIKSLHDAAFQEAVALKSQAAVRYGPSHKDQVAFKLGEGIKVQLSNKAGEWRQVVLPNGETGWMNQEDMGII